MRAGIDVSQHQLRVDWPDVKRAGYDFAICKCSEGQDFRDSAWNEARARSARSAGLVLGVYHFLRPKPGRNGAVEAEWAWKTARSAGWGEPGDLKMTVDIEQTELGPASTFGYLKRFVEEWERLAGHKPIVYTYPSFWVSKMGDRRDNLGCPLWIAHYGVTAPTIPFAWNEWTIWQHTSSGKVPGVSGNCDVNKAKSLPVIEEEKDPVPEVDVKELQRTLNTFTSKWLKGVAPLIVDGDKAFLTNRRIQTVKWYLGYGKDRDSRVTSEFIRRVRHPRDKKYFPKGMIGTGRRRRAAQKARWARNQLEATITPGVVKFDGRPCAKWLAEKLLKARAAGRWHGQLNSGWRDPLYSRSLCIQMCGAPSCSGRCAGVNSNHSGVRHPKGAVDVSDYVRFAEEAGRLNLGIRNALGSRDPVHFSVSGS
jgi:lysozyme